MKKEVSMRLARLTPSVFRSQQITSVVSRPLFSASEVCPSRFMEFATQDMVANASERCYVNAVSNSKRALALHVERIAIAFGVRQWKPTAKKQRDLRGFFRNYRFLSLCGVNTVELARRVTAIRNALEHRFILPSRAEAEEVLEVVDLYLAATGHHAGSFIYNRTLHSPALTKEVNRAPHNMQMDRLIDGDYQLVTFPGSGVIEVLACPKLQILEAYDHWSAVRMLNQTLAHPQHGLKPHVRVNVSKDPMGYFAWAKLLCGARA